MSLVKVKALKKIYPGAGGQTVLAGINFAVADGEFVAIMGPSGSGKSTILAALGGLSCPTSGKVIVDGIDIYRLDSDTLADFRREYLGFVFQEHQLIPYLTAAENVMLPLTISSHPSRTHRDLAIAVLDKVRLPGKYDRLPSQLSSGEQERVAIARALVNSPPIILADEPTGSLDTPTRKEIIRLFKELNENDALTIVMVTHNPQDARAASRILNIRDGMMLSETLTTGHERTSS